VDQVRPEDDEMDGPSDITPSDEELPSVKVDVKEGRGDDEKPNIQGHKANFDAGAGGNAAKASHQSQDATSEGCSNENEPARKKRRVEASPTSEQRSPSDVLIVVSQWVENLLSKLRKSHSSFVDVLKQNRDLEQRVDTLGRSRDCS